MRRQLASAGRYLSDARLAVGSGGNLSAREPGSDIFWVTGTGTWLGQLTEASFVPIRLRDGSVARTGSVSARPRRGRTPAGREHAGLRPPTSELALHVELLRARPDVNAVVHLHPQISILLDALGERIRLFTTDHTHYVRRIAPIPFYPPGSQALATAAVEAASDGTNCVILAHHGCAVLAGTVEMACRRAVNLEEAALLTYRAVMLTGGRPGVSIPECPADFLDRYGS